MNPQTIWLRRINPAFKQLETVVSKLARLEAKSPLKAPFMGRSGDGNVPFCSRLLSLITCHLLLGMAHLTKEGAARPRCIIGSRALGAKPKKNPSDACLAVRQANLHACRVTYCSIGLSMTTLPAWLADRPQTKSGSRYYSATGEFSPGFLG